MLRCLKLKHIKALQNVSALQKMVKSREEKLLEATSLTKKQQREKKSSEEADI